MPSGLVPATLAGGTGIVQTRVTPAYASTLRAWCAGYWPLDEPGGSPRFSRVGGYIGAEVNGPLISVSGTGGAATQFASASNQGIEIGGSAVDQQSGLSGEDFTVACLLMVTTSDAGQTPFYGGNTGQLALCTRSNSFRPRLQLTTGQINPVYSLSFPANSLHYVAVRWVQGTQKLTITLDANKTTSETQTLAAPMSTSPGANLDAYIGKAPGFGSTMNGTMQHCGVWKRALTDAELSYLYFCVMNGINAFAL